MVHRPIGSEGLWCGEIKWYRPTDRFGVEKSSGRPRLAVRSLI